MSKDEIQSLMVQDSGRGEMKIQGAVNVRVLGCHLGGQDGCRRHLLWKCALVPGTSASGNNYDDNGDDDDGDGRILVVLVAFMHHIISCSVFSTKCFTYVSPCIFTIPLWYYVHFTNVEVQDLRVSVTYPRSQS